MELTDEAITEFAEHLIPEAFRTASSATRVQIHPPGRLEIPGHWLASCIRDAVAARGVTGEPLNAVIYVQRGGERWRWDSPSVIWPIEALAETVRGEIAGFREPRVFVASMFDRWRQTIRAQRRGQTTEPGWALQYYAEERSRFDAQVMSGFVDVLGTPASREPALRDQRAFERAAHSVMTGHPSRRSYRLRR